MRVRVFSFSFLRFRGALVLRGISLAMALAASALLSAAWAATPYVPPRGEWALKQPGDVGMSARKLRRAVAYAQEHESTLPKDLGLRHDLGFGREPHGAGVGPFRTRAEATGLVIRAGYLVASWGDLDRVDMTYSVSKSFLSTTVGLAWADGLMQLDAPVAKTMAPVLLPLGDGERDLHQADHTHQPVTLFEDPHNVKITWEHLLRQTSAWRGTLWGKPDWADRPAADSATWLDKARPEPGTAYEYNDVRVNLLALAATQLWRRPLPQVLRERVMDPIGAAPTWRWFGYENSWINLDGQRVQVVSGGGHWGGGMMLSAYDQGRFGLLTLRRGRWGEKQLLPDEWFTQALTPGVNPGYGFMNYFLNQPEKEGNKSLPSAPDDAFSHRGAGVNLVYVDPTHDLVIVARWIENDHIDGLVKRVIDAIESP